MELNQIKEIIRRELPHIIQEDHEMRRFIIEIAESKFADKKETESRFDRILEELRLDRIEQREKWEASNKKWEEYTRKQDENAEARKLEWEEYTRKQDEKWDEYTRKQDEKAKARKLEWEEYTQKQDEKWDEYTRKQDEKAKARKLEWEEYIRKQDEKWEAQNIKWEENQKRIEKISAKIDVRLGGLGARWGMESESAFRSGLRGILEESFGVEVLNINEFDEDGEVFGLPDQVELDIIIRNSTLIICEIKSSMHKGDVYLFKRKIAYYENHHGKKVDRKIIITPYIDKYAQGLADKLNMEVYSHSGEINEL